MFSGLKRSTVAALLVASLGYFVDIYDLILFSVVRIPSLKDMGFAEVELMDKGLILLNLQMIGMILGGILFGTLGDKLGRLKVLFGSILLYSISNLLNAYVQNFEQYACLRFIAGVGLAGELGAGITLISELLPARVRGYGTTLVATVGVSGALFAWTIADHFNWRIAYIVGGVMGLCLLALRLGVVESGIFESVHKQAHIQKGNFWMLFKTRSRFFRFLACIAIGLPIWYVIGILITLSPEIRAAIGTDGVVVAGKAVFYSYSGLILGDLLSGLLSQFFKNRKKSILAFMVTTWIGVGFYYFGPTLNEARFYVLCAFLGLGAGYWAMFVTVAAENFGTNMRATVATSVPNFVRGSLVPMTLLLSLLKPTFGIIHASLFVGVLSLVFAYWGYLFLNESFHNELDFFEE